MRSRYRVKGRVRVCVIASDGQIKRHEPGFIRRLFGLPGRPMISKRHNTITRQGEALIADLLRPTPAYSKVQTGSGYMQIGTGWTGNSPKTNTRCNTPLSVNAFRALEAGFPQLGAAFGQTGDNVLIYRAFYPAGSIAASGINEACLTNGNTGAAVSLAYAQVTPAVTVGSLDSLQLDWEITISGV